VAVLMVLALLFALPITATARGEAAPMTRGELMRILHVAPFRKFDPTQAGVAASPPPVLPPALQSSSEPAPPKEPVTRPQVPRLWFGGQRLRVRKRRRRRG
jgi:hypothetical protein